MDTKTAITAVKNVGTLAVFTYASVQSAKGFYALGCAVKDVVVNRTASK